MIQFRQHFVKCGELKARVSYHLNSRIDGRNCVTLYAKDWCRTLGKIFREGYRNETDSMTDYFEQGSVVLFEDNPYYQAAKKVAEMLTAKRQAKYGA